MQFSLFSASSALLALAGAGVNATPIEQRDIISDVECIVVTLVIQVLATLNNETAFCSSYLSIPTVTSTSIATSTTFSTTTRTTTTGTNISTGPAFTVTETTSETITTCLLTTVQKRQLLPSSSRSSSASRVTSAAPLISVSVGVPIVSPSVSVPVSIPAVVALFGSAQVSTACRCLGIPTPSTTITRTSTITPTATRVVSVAAISVTTPTTTTTVTSTSTEIVCPTPSSCANQGLLWAQYTHTLGRNDDNVYSNFIPEVFKSQIPGVSGITSTIGGINLPGGGVLSVYGSDQTFSTDYFALDHKGYLFAVATGTYTFSFTRVDDAAFLWVGPTAQDGWTRANADLEVTIRNVDDGPGRGSTTVDLVEGQYLPIRIMFGQGHSAAEFQLSVTAPDGTVFLNSNTENSPYIVQYSCDRVTAPEFSAWDPKVTSR
ncbi:GLEYA domain-containing protein [Pestalotiopsis sp. NC0098]|nr:GLEYA domain-containing protein [Pestalotiopsis sp. NC0098]